MLSCKICGVIFTLLCFNLRVIKCNNEEQIYKFTPESNYFSLNEGEDFRVEFEEIEGKTNFTHCYYKSSNFSHDYDIHKNTHNYYARDYFPYSNQTKCGFRIKNVTDQTPRRWIISAYDQKSEQNYTENITIDFFYNVEPLLKTAPVLKGASFLNYLKSEIIFEKCFFSYEDIRIELDLTTQKLLPFKGEYGRLSSLGAQKCGFKLTNTSLTDPKDLILIASDSANRTYRAKTKLIVLNLDRLTTNRTIDVYLGDSLTIICGKESDSVINGEQQYCRLHNPKGELVSENQLCAHRLEIVTLQDLGVWSCYVGYRLQMEPLYFETEVREKKRESVDLWQHNNNERLEIGCKLNNYQIYKADFCKFTRPDGVDFKTFKGAASLRYTSLKTDLDKGVCGIEIQLPLLNTEKGTWKCEIHTGLNSAGGFIDVKRHKIPNNKLPSKQNSKINVHLKNPFKIECQVYYSADRCYIIAPNGTQFKSKIPTRASLGECALDVRAAENSDNGTWSCYFAKKNGVEDEKISIDVSVIELKVIYNPEIEVREDDDVEMICNTGGIPLEFCRFTSPNDENFSLREDQADKSQNISRKIFYLGRGLDFGDCGIRIQNANFDYHNGKWICHLSPGRSGYNHKTELKKEINLIIHASRVQVLESIIGCSLAVLIVLISAIFAVKIYKKRRACGETNNVEYTRNLENESEENSRIILDRSQNNYNGNKID